MPARIRHPFPAALATGIVAIVLAACGTGPSPSPSPPPKPSPTPPADRAVVVTIKVVGETYRIRLTQADDIATARALLAGTGSATIPNGRIVRGDADVNTGYSWHIDPADIEWAEVTMEVCDGLPSFVEDGTLTGDRFCPWAAKVVAIDPAP